MIDASLSTRRLPDGVTATPIWGGPLRADGSRRDRFALTWTHPARTGPMNLLMCMNPSGASETEADQTLLKSWGFSDRWNGGPFTMLNACPYRATTPRDMQLLQDSLAENRRVIRQVIGDALNFHGAGLGNVVVGWGSPSLPRSLALAFAAETRAVLAVFVEVLGRRPLCLGTTRDGSPAHPLMLAYDTPLRPWGAP